MKLDLAKNLMRGDPKFVVLGSSHAATGIDLKKTDTNELLGQIGVFEGLAEKKPAAGVLEQR